MSKQESLHWETHIEGILHKSISSSSKTPVTDHPLKMLTVTDRIPQRRNSQTSTGQITPVTNPALILEPLRVALEGLDPLTEFAIQEMDPLSKMAAEERHMKSPSDKHSSKLQPFSTIPSWSSRKATILSKFTTSEKISIVTSFLCDGEKVMVKAQSTPLDKVQHRLEQLDYFEEGSQRKLDLNQAEYMGRIEQLNKELVTAWHSEQRVKSLKIAIQCAKLLADTDVLSFYPSKFVLITEILDIFGQLVYHRLRTKADYCKPGTKISIPLPEDFTPDMVPESAKETCLNWFYKIASIRELVPRLYVEIALLKSYNFISSKEAIEALDRITPMINGIGNPLVALYIRCYLCRVGMTVSPQSTSYIKANFLRFLDCYPHLFSRSVKAELNKQRMDISQYMTLFTPALDFILEGVAYNASEHQLDDLLMKCSTQGNSSLILNSIMSAFKPAWIAPRALRILEMICQSFDEGIPLHVLLKTLGLCISVCPPPIEHRRHVLNIVWKHISDLTDPDTYISCVEAWIQYTVQYFSIHELNTVLSDIVKHATLEKNYDNCYNNLKLVVDKILLHIRDFEGLLEMDNFLPFIDLFQVKSAKVEVVKKVLTCCMNEHHTSDPVITNTFMFFGGILHDSVNAFTPEDEHRQIGEILCGVVRRVDYGRDFEQQLDFYVEARGAFQNIHAVLVQLIQCVNNLAIKTRQVVKGFHTRKTGDFVRACAAYCFITIPSIACVRTRLELYLLSGQVALFNQCLGQADACFKAALSIIPELQNNEKVSRNELFLVSYVKQFLSVLLVVPDNPERGCLSITRGLLNILQTYEWDKYNGSLIVIYLCVLDMLSAMAQEQLPYHVDRVEANDSLYGSDPKFISEVNKMCTTILGEILTQMKALGPGRRQSSLALETCVRVAIRSDLNSPALITLALNLWQLAGKNGMCDSKLMNRTCQYLKNKLGSRTNAAKFLNALQIP